MFMRLLEQLYIFFLTLALIIAYYIAKRDTNKLNWIQSIGTKTISIYLLLVCGVTTIGTLSASIIFHDINLFWTGILFLVTWLIIIGFYRWDYESFPSFKGKNEY